MTSTPTFSAKPSHLIVHVRDTDRTIAFYGVITGWTFVNYVITGYVYKVTVEVLVMPITYRVIADVTDPSGETRSADRAVRAGFASLQADVKAEAWQSSGPDGALRRQRGDGGQQSRMKGEACKHYAPRTITMTKSYHPTPFSPKRRNFAARFLAGWTL